MSRHRRRVLVLQAWWSNQILEGVARYAAEHGWILNCEMAWHRGLPTHWEGDGIIAYADRDRAMAGFVRKRRLPVVDLASFGDLLAAPKVTISNEAIARCAVDHMRTLGFDRLACVDASDHPIDRLRHGCFQRAAIESGADFQMLPLKGLARTLRRIRRPMGLLTTKDQFAEEVIRICVEAGFRVPEEFAVVGVNDTPILCDLTAIPITSVNPDFERNGYEAAALLDRLMDGEPAGPETIVIPPKGITIRRSTDTLCIPDLDTARTLRFLRDHFLEPISVRDATAGLSTPLRQIQRRFREFTGRTAVQELIRLRIGHACKLLLDPDHKVEWIARACGFASRTHFIRTFRSVTGENPKDYRKRLTAPARSAGAKR